MRTFNLLSSESVCAELGTRIRRLRLSRNLSQQQIAEMTMASLSSIRRLESQGQGSVLLLVRVAHALQAANHLDALFHEPVFTIAQAEREEAMALRKRARLPRLNKPKRSLSPLCV